MVTGLGISHQTRRFSQNQRFSSSRQERDAAHAKGFETPIPGTRLEVSSEKLYERGYFIEIVSSIVWDTPSKQFRIRTDRFYQNGNRDDLTCASLERGIADKTCLGGLYPDGAVVDQEKGRIYFQDGRWMDGPSGQMFTVHGEPVGANCDKVQKDC